MLFSLFLFDLLFSLYMSIPCAKLRTRTSHASQNGIVSGSTCDASMIPRWSTIARASPLRRASVLVHMPVAVVIPSIISTIQKHGSRFPEPLTNNSRSLSLLLQSPNNLPSRYASTIRFLSHGDMLPPLWSSINESNKSQKSLPSIICSVCHIFVGSLWWVNSTLDTFVKIATAHVPDTFKDTCH